MAQLARYDNDGNVEVMYLAIMKDRGYSDSGISNYLVIKEYHIMGEPEYHKRISNHRSVEDTLFTFKVHYQELTNQEYIPGNEIPPSGSYYDHYSTMLPIRPRIPSLKQICFSVLKELFIIDRDDFNQKFRGLPMDLLPEFCSSCLKDRRPVGHQLSEYLLATVPSMPEFEGVNIVELLPFQPMVEAMFNRHLYSLFIKCDQVPRHLLNPAVLDNLLIDVYDNIHLFKSTPLPPDNVLFPPSSHISKAPGDTSIVDYDTFLKNFTEYTSSQFSSLTSEDWENIVIFGGALTSSLIGATKGFEVADIDVCIYGLSDPKAGQSKVANIMRTLGVFNNDDYSLTIDQTSATFSRHYPYRHIQFMLQHQPTLQDVLLNVDVDCACFTFDGKRVWTTQRGVMAMNHRSNLATQYGATLTLDWHYQRKLIRYRRRGFGIGYLPTKVILQEMATLNHGVRANGIWSLLSAKEDVVTLMQLTRHVMRNPGSLSVGKWRRHELPAYTGVHSFNDNIESSSKSFDEEKDETFSDDSLSCYSDVEDDYDDFDNYDDDDDFDEVDITTQTYSHSLTSTTTTTTTTLGDL
ncbi:hypothetical protein SAMD00019534_002840 [Acytostelium subglobosum LB1]|uniref:hypothetical protein n=1 Tax=Acytostelium subglobosum LB1 TaxID=1410327 RepID=UPI000644CD84|nr:hypothetical protein SAMD00019534_002840 [Acytostelium subglobosum LB1]GAM17109.1 hypothetical protein SAMD00019534_002840 [Acytostelium subglobosum LB1]|eukprot:XP_012759171.1 hypothetical protein SAMD00019534_002840 [Acytostelium subglobosum LB1]